MKLIITLLVFFPFVIHIDWLQSNEIIEVTGIELM